MIANKTLGDMDEPKEKSLHEEINKLNKAPEQIKYRNRLLKLYDKVSDFKDMIYVQCELELSHKILAGEVTKTYV